MTVAGKEGRLESPTVLAWVRRLTCRAAEYFDDHRVVNPCAGPIDPHHVDGKGMGGARCRDDRVVPLCRRHHDRLHALNLDMDDIGRLCPGWADETLRRFLDHAEVHEVRAYVEDLVRWKERPLAVAW